MGAERVQNPDLGPFIVRQVGHNADANHLVRMHRRLAHSKGAHDLQPGHHLAHHRIVAVEAAGRFAHQEDLAIGAVRRSVPAHAHDAGAKRAPARHPVIGRHGHAGLIDRGVRGGADEAFCFALGPCDHGARNVGAQAEIEFGRKVRLVALAAVLVVGIAGLGDERLNHPVE